jgi:hypothetical protein
MALTALSNSVMAGESGIQLPVPTTPLPLQVYTLKKVFDICDPSFIPGGSVPPSNPQIQDPKVNPRGCVDYMGELRANEYAFTGEQIAELVDVRDLAGSSPTTSAIMQVDEEDVAICNVVTLADLQSNVNGTCQLRLGQIGDCTPGNNNKPFCDQYSTECEWIPDLIWFGHKIDLSQIPAKDTVTQGYNPDYDTMYECILTVTPDTGADGLTADVGNGIVSEVKVVATDGIGITGESPVQEWYFNPPIIIDVDTNDHNAITFENGESGQTVYSLNTLKITNEAEGGVDLFVWLAGTDLYSPNAPAKCPTSNILDVDKYLEYRCKIGTLFNNPWNFVQNPDDRQSCSFAICQNATSLVPDTGMPSIIGNWHTAECWFRLTYPVPCEGTFTDGQILIFARAI